VSWARGRTERVGASIAGLTSPNLKGVSGTPLGGTLASLGFIDGNRQVRTFGSSLQRFALPDEGVHNPVFAKSELKGSLLGEAWLFPDFLLRGNFGQFFGFEFLLFFAVSLELVLPYTVGLAQVSPFRKDLWPVCLPASPKDSSVWTLLGGRRMVEWSVQ
jgi:hypothetical protein